jgi:sec-independent protein translocase protein TatA
MGSLGLPEILLIMVIALLVFGPKRLPEIGRTLGKGLAEFRKATNDLKNTISTELSIEDEQPARPRRVDLAGVTPVFGQEPAPAARPLPAETMPQVPQGAESASPHEPAELAPTAAVPAAEPLPPAASGEPTST